ncbi:MAG: hypothetical protein IKZ49_00125 [Alphaproteobacteria bacterium]|nr:hypothetical protein [Alphaproteobacteria bacterium]
MAKLHFFYGVMGAAKSTELIINAYKLKNSGKQYEVIKPAIDTRDSESEVVSRIGLKEPATALDNLDSYAPKEETKFILVDEIQFFSVQDIDRLNHIAKDLDKTVFCYGLLLDSNGNRFPASDWLFKVCNEKHRLEAVCELPECRKLATHHLRFNAETGDVVRNGNQVEVGDSKEKLASQSFYKSVCPQHFTSIYIKQPSFNWYRYMRETQNKTK